LFARLGNCSMRCSTSCIHTVVEQEQKACLNCGSYFIRVPKAAPWTFTFVSNLVSFFACSLCF
ncbi:MAG: hypothetical protein M8364_17860, partial [Methylobacter sp.]|uniref:hypothetical protein n=1 Tax=Methylobacter sp. TaxID=2051955 RepID=UPI002586109F